MRNGRLKLVAWLIVVAVTLSGCIGGRSESDVDIENKLGEVTTKFIQALEESDPEAVEAQLADMVTLGIPDFGPIAFFMQELEVTLTFIQRILRGEISPPDDIGDDGEGGELFAGPLGARTMELVEQRLAEDSDGLMAAAEFGGGFLEDGLLALWYYLVTGADFNQIAAWVQASHVGDDALTIPKQVFTGTLAIALNVGVVLEVEDGDLVFSPEKDRWTTVLVVSAHVPFAEDEESLSSAAEVLLGFRKVKGRWVIDLFSVREDEETVAAKAELRALNTSFVEAVEAQDLDSLRALFTELVEFTTPDGDMFMDIVEFLAAELRNYLEDPDEAEVPDYVIEMFGERLAELDPADPDSLTELESIAAQWLLAEYFAWLTRPDQETEPDWEQIAEWAAASEVTDYGTFVVPQALLAEMFRNFYENRGYTYQLLGKPSPPYLYDEFWYVDLYLDEYRYGAFNAIVGLCLGFDEYDGQWKIDYFELFDLLIYPIVGFLPLW